MIAVNYAMTRKRTTRFRGASWHPTPNEAGLPVPFRILPLERADVSLARLIDQCL
jgi:hypothetical protein